jgi:hypothetical protein
MSGIYGKYWGQERYWAFVRRPDGKGLLGKTKRRWDDNIKIHLKEVRRGGMDWITAVWWALVSAVMNFRVPNIAGNFLTCCEPVSF